MLTRQECIQHWQIELDRYIIKLEEATTQEKKKEHAKWISTCMKRIFDLKGLDKDKKD